MLTELHIENMGVIETLDLVIGRGLIALTGETGAGKTMLVEAINLLVGSRADSAVIRPGATEARIEGRFVIGDSETVLCRVVPADGRSRAYVNGRLATVANLAEYGTGLIDLHGQHAHQSLLGASAQRQALDHYSGVDLAPLRESRARLTEIHANLATIGGDERARAREVDLLRFQVQEISNAALGDPDEDALLSKEEDLLADSVSHRQALWQALAALTDDGGASDSLGTALFALGHRDALGDLEARLRGLQGELDDVSTTLRNTAEAIEENPQRLDEIRLRRQLLVDLRRKYGESIHDVIVYGDQAASRLAELEGYEARAKELDAERLAAIDDLQRAEESVGNARRQAAPRLAKEVQAHLRLLAMAHAILDVEVGPNPGDEVKFLLAANPGSEPQSLTKVASGGELARTMLALRMVLTEAPDTLVFDEVDAGVGGEAAVAVARALGELGQRHQVLVVTHLAQVAAAATQQIKVTKTVRDKKTYAQATPLEGQERVTEIARMLSGGVAESSALQHARDLLKENSAHVSSSKQPRN
ncbi:MAG: DNA repair protein RecN [Ilumatobacteraceae bacterium]